MANQLGIELGGEALRCAFCSVIAGAEQGALVYEDEKTTAFLDRQPVFHGHTLVMPKQHVETLSDLPVDEIPEVFGTVRLLMMAVEQAMRAHGTFIAINNRVSQSVPHLHVHIIPRRQKDGLRGFFWPRVKYEDEGHLKNTATAVQQALRELNTNQI